MFLQLREQIPIPLIQLLGRKPARLPDHPQNPLVILRPPDPGRLGGIRQIHRPTRHRRHLFASRLHQLRSRPVLLSRPWQRDSCLQLHLSQRQLLLVDLQPFSQLGLRQDAPILPQHPQGVQLLGQRLPPTLTGEAQGQLPRLLPHELQLTGRQGHDTPQLLLQLLGGQDLHPTLVIQAPGFNDPSIQPLDRGSLCLTRSQRGHAAPKVDLQPAAPRGLQHGVRGLLPASPRLGEPHHVPSVVPGAPGSILRLRRGEGQCVGVIVDLAAPILGVDVIQREGPGLLPFPVPAAGPHPNGLPLHLPEVGRHRRPEDVAGDLRCVLQAPAQLPRQGDQRLLGLAEQAAPDGQLVPLQVVPHRQLPEQFRGRKLLLARVPPHLLPEVRVDHLGFHLTIPAQVAHAPFQPTGLFRLLQMAAKVHGDPGGRTHPGAVVVADHQIHGATWEWS